MANTLEDFISNVGRDKPFVIPDYQRGYIWGQHSSDYREDAVSHICKTILEGFESPNQHEIFLQGITYCRDNHGRTILVDGQQRTTFFFILLKLLRYKGLDITYEVRKDSDTYLHEFSVDGEIEDCDHDEQDVFFFKKTIRIIRNILPIGNENRDSLTNYILHRIKFIFVEIDKKDATLVFSMMNGNKAEMKQPELIKADLLRMSSFNGNGEIKEYENIQIRGRMAREWDKWLYWWKQSDVEALYKHKEQQLGWLLPVFFDKEVSFEAFRERIIAGSGQSTVKEAKAQFRELRLLQKRFEDVFNNAVSYNYVGFILRSYQTENERMIFLSWLIKERRSFSVEENSKALRLYFDARLIGLPHNQISSMINDGESDMSKEVKIFLDVLLLEELYRQDKAKANLWFLRRNILEDNNQGEESHGRKFDFSIWDNKSLEHILPKSLVYHANSELHTYYNWNDEEISEGETQTMINRDDIPAISVNGIEQPISLTEHSLGNLVLLYGNNNSSFGKLGFEKKKDKFFCRADQTFKSRHLLHTVKVFANSSWELVDIAEQMVAEINSFGKDFGLGEKIAHVIYN